MRFVTSDIDNIMDYVQQIPSFYNSKIKIIKWNTLSSSTTLTAAGIAAVIVFLILIIAIVYLLKFKVRRKETPLHNVENNLPNQLQQLAPAQNPLYDYLYY
ncbi:unnamed protein product [Didymodactylos carnosus]|uniref:Uncharacterized protein n=1 Tax=Didymodactylos carnosus TaxID=1234261 RepID=A0A815GKX8_9BILA|nr:unnamed protein product [Didymodactylos carnosus]CAF1340217.1 unnamed protein product [Didymodactylos carnosus]CAF3613119.1 unnamed protein product [Didymodactylos carnosus]CAF4200530.1 unnamed protein product [Didymodactylos carnosus]